MFPTLASEGFAPCPEEARRVLTHTLRLEAKMQITCEHSPGHRDGLAAGQEQVLLFRLPFQSLLGSERLGE